MKRILMAVVLAFACFACGNNDCEDAVDKLKECTGQSGDSSKASDCSGQAECIAKCVNSASCDEIKSSDLNSSYYKCTTACLK